MFGVLVDVSGSMESAYALNRSNDANVERTHAILTTIINIVKQEVVHHDRRESIFVCAFGLSGPTVTCDLVSLPVGNCRPKKERYARERWIPSTD